MSNLKTRALSAYFRKHGANAAQPTVTEVEHNGLHYVVLSNVSGTLAVYRVRTVNGEQVLKGLKRWPAALNEVA